MIINIPSHSLAIPTKKQTEGEEQSIPISIDLKCRFDQMFLAYRLQKNEIRSLEQSFHS